MITIASAFALGAVFGLGLAVSEMTNPARVIGFLNVAGPWDPTLAAVMGGALLVAATAFPVVIRRKRALLAERLTLPIRTDIDKPLILGAVVFGVGWGLAGLCPGPALAGLASGSPGLILFVVAMIAGQILAARWAKS